VVFIIFVSGFISYQESDDERQKMESAKKRNSWEPYLLPFEQQVVGTPNERTPATCRVGIQKQSKTPIQGEDDFVGELLYCACSTVESING